MTVTTAEYTWAPMLERYLNSIFDGSFDTSFAYQGMSDGVITLTDWGPLYDRLSDDAKADIAAEIARISGAPLSVFVGPLMDKSGTEVVAEGESLRRRCAEVDGLGHAQRRRSRPLVGPDGRLVASDPDPGCLPSHSARAGKADGQLPSTIAFGGFESR